MKTYKTRTAFGSKCHLVCRPKTNKDTLVYRQENDSYIVKIYHYKNKNADAPQFLIELSVKRFNYFTIDGNGNTLKEAMTDIRNQFEALTGDFSAASEDISDRTWNVCN
jgi:hypothetical protein